MTVGLVLEYYVPITDRVEAYASNEPKAFYPGIRVRLVMTESSRIDGQSLSSSMHHQERTSHSVQAHRDIPGWVS